MNWKNDFKFSALVILLVITAIALLDNARSADSAAKLVEDKNRLEKKVISLEEEKERHCPFYRTVLYSINTEEVFEVVCGFKYFISCDIHIVGYYSA